jgi:hypothetical protein
MSPLKSLKIYSVLVFVRIIIVVFQRSSIIHHINDELILFTPHLNRILFTLITALGDFAVLKFLSSIYGSFQGIEMFTLNYFINGFLLVHLSRPTVSNIFFNSLLCLVACFSPSKFRAPHLSKIITYPVSLALPFLFVYYWSNLSYLYPLSALLCLALALALPFPMRGTKYFHIFVAIMYSRFFNFAAIQTIDKWRQDAPQNEKLFVIASSEYLPNFVMSEDIHVINQDTFKSKIDNPKWRKGIDELMKDDDFIQMRCSLLLNWNGYLISQYLVENYGYKLVKDTYQIDINNFSHRPLSDDIWYLLKK